MRKILLPLLLFLPLMVNAQPYVAEGLAFVSPSLGYRLSPYFSAEFGAFDERSDKSSGVTPHTPFVPNESTSTQSTTETNTTGYRLSMIGSLPVMPSVSLIARPSIYRLKGEVETRSTTTRLVNDPVTGRQVFSETIAQTSSKSYHESTRLGLGVGAEWRPDKHFALRGLIEAQKSGMPNIPTIKLHTIDVVWYF